MYRSTLFLLLSVFVLPCEASSQVFSGAAQSESTGEPIPGALVMILNERGEVQRATLTDSLGRFRVAASHQGTYYLQAERLGFQTVTAGPLRILADQPVSVSLRLPFEPIALEGIQVVSERRCFVRPREGLLAHRLWEQAAKALRAAAVLQDRQLVEYTVTTYERDVSLAEGRLRTRRQDPRRVTGRPFATLAPQELAEGGYVRIQGDSIQFHGPNAHVLLSDSFLDTHCLRVQREGEERDGLVGIGFEPVRERSVPDIAGILWLNEEGELQHVQYRYTGMDQERLGSAGGRIEFDLLESGAWIVRSWWIRMPRIESMIDWERWGERRDVPVSFVEAGGEVTNVHVYADGEPRLQPSGTS